MNRISIIVSLSFISACTNNTLDNHPNNTSPWPSYGYEGYSESINKKAGVDSFNCGFIDLTQKKYSKEELSKAKNCVQHSIDNSQAFRFGTRFIPEDSHLFKSVLLSPEKEYWVVMFDVMIGEDSDTQLFIKRCDSIDIYSENNDIYFVENDCTNQSSSDWAE